MRILLTGGSSFTGLWFARSLVAAGHTVVAPLKGGKEEYYPDGSAEVTCSRLPEVSPLVHNSPRVRLKNVAKPV